jgi:LuxR family maltose regulon positive regulatory protein
MPGMAHPGDAWRPATAHHGGMRIRFGEDEGVSFARSKIHPPQPRPGLLLERPRVEQALRDACRSHRVVLLSAPAGSGKTALMAALLRQTGARDAAAWVALDPGDDLHRLLDCLLAALEPFDLPWRHAPQALLRNALAGGTKERQLAVDELVDTLHAAEVAQGLLVLDDLQHLLDAAASHFLERLAERLVGHADPRWTLLLATRESSALPLARLRAAGELFEFGQTELQLSADEVRQLCERAGLDAQSATTIHRRSGGWAAGVRLALHGARGGHPGSAMDRQAFDYLSTEVLARLDPALRAFLVATSVLPELDEARCLALTGDARSAAWLDEIERLGLFAVVVDEAPRTLRLHDLFRDALQHRLRVERGNEWRELTVRAAATEADALRRQALWLRAGCHEQAAGELRRLAWPLLFEGAASSVLHLCEAFPSSFSESSAELQLVLGQVHWQLWSAREAERHLLSAEGLFAARGAGSDAQKARALRAVVLVATGRLDAAEALLQPLRAATADNELRVLTGVCDTWLAMESGAFNAVAPRFAALLDAIEAEPALESWSLVVPSPRLSACAGAAPLLGRWAQGALAMTGDRPLPLQALALLARAWQAFWQGRLAEAALQLEQADAASGWIGEHVIARSHALALRALLALLRGAPEQALQLAQERLAEFPGGYGDWGRWQMQFFVARVAALTGQAATLREALEGLDALQALLPGAAPRRLQPALGLRGCLAALEGRGEAARALWQQALADEEACDLLGMAQELRLRLADHELQRGAPDAAARWLAPLREAEGPRGALLLPALLRRVALQLDGPWYRWVQDSEESAPAVAAAANTPLTARELEVVELIAQGQSNKLIARNLNLSPHTVKRHIAHAMNKLNVNARSQLAAWFCARV